MPVCHVAQKPLLLQRSGELSIPSSDNPAPQHVMGSLWLALLLLKCSLSPTENDLLSLQSGADMVRREAVYSKAKTMATCK